MVISLTSASTWELCENDRVVSLSTLVRAYSFNERCRNLIGHTPCGDFCSFHCSLPHQKFSSFHFPPPLLSKDELFYSNMMRVEVRLNGFHAGSERPIALLRGALALQMDVTVEGRLLCCLFVKRGSEERILHLWRVDAACTNPKLTFDVLKKQKQKTKTRWVYSIL